MHSFYWRHLIKGKPRRGCLQSHLLKANKNPSSLLVFSCDRDYTVGGFNKEVCRTLTQQKEEKHMPMYSHGTTTPEISSSSNASMDPGSLAMLFKFQPDFSYRSSSSSSTLVVNLPFFAFGNPLLNLPVSTSAPYRTCHNKWWGVGYKSTTQDRILQNQCLCTNHVLYITPAVPVISYSYFHQ